VSSAFFFLRLATESVWGAATGELRRGGFTVLRRLVFWRVARPVVTPLPGGMFSTSVRCRAPFSRMVPHFRQSIPPVEWFPPMRSEMGTIPSRPHIRLEIGVPEPREASATTEMSDEPLHDSYFRRQGGPLLSPINERRCIIGRERLSLVHN
jgi:hypothetical protein